MDYAKRAAEIAATDYVARASGCLLHWGSCRYLLGKSCNCDRREDVESVADALRGFDMVHLAELQAAHDAGVAEAGDVREVLADLLSAINEDQEALVSYFADVGAEHERDCPEDDTCECELIVAMHKAHKRLAGAVHDATKLLEEGR